MALWFSGGRSNRGSSLKVKAAYRPKTFFDKIFSFLDFIEDFFFIPPDKIRLKINGCDNSKKETNSSNKRKLKKRTLEENHYRIKTDVRTDVIKTDVAVDYRC